MLEKRLIFSCFEASCKTFVNKIFCLRKNAATFRRCQTDKNPSGIRGPQSSEFHCETGVVYVGFGNLARFAARPAADE